MPYPYQTAPSDARGYLHPGYPQSLAEYGSPRYLPLSGGWILELPAGIPKESETIHATLVREMLEETCCTVVTARLLGFSCGACVSGPEQGLVLVRSLWRAEVEVHPWAPQHEIAHRRIVPAGELRAHLHIDAGFEPIYARWLAEAGL